MAGHALGAGGTTWMPDAGSKQSATQDSIAAHMIPWFAFTKQPVENIVESVYPLQCQMNLKHLKSMFLTPLT